MIKTVRVLIKGLVLVLMLSSCKQDSIEEKNRDTLFTIVPASYSNLLFENKVVQRKKNNHMINSAFISGGGVAVGDINMDGLQDIFLLVIKSEIVFI
jgi:hypothetical protein